MFDVKKFVGLTFGCVTARLRARFPAQRRSHTGVRKVFMMRFCKSHAALFRFAAFLALLIAVVSGGPVQAGQAIPAPPPPTPFGSTDYIIGAGDGLTIFVWHNP